MHQHSPAVVRLQLHLPEQNIVFFDSDKADAEQILYQPNIHKTSLTEFFVICRKYPNIHTFTYPKMSNKFVWNNSKKE